MSELKSEQAINLKKLEDIVSACNRCGFCTSYCPTYNATGLETQSPRGRNQAFRSILEGKLKDIKQIEEIVDTCLLCGECTSVCFAEVPTAALMIQARNLINQKSESKGKKIVFTLLEKFPRLFTLLLEISFLFKNLGFSLLLRKLGLLEKISPELHHADRLVTRLPFRFLKGTSLARRHSEGNFMKKTLRAGGHLATAQSAAQGRVAYLTACGSQYLRPSIGTATFKLFEKLGVEFAIPELLCCGLPPASYGVLDSVKGMAKENITRLERGHYDVYVTDDSSCAAHFRDYPSYLKDEKEWFTRAHSVQQKYKDISSVLVQRGLIDHLKKSSWHGGLVAYHDPCKAQYAQKITKPPRELISSFRGLKMVPVLEADQCCGGGGTYSFVHPELSQAVLKRKISNIVASGCQILVTSSVSCLIQLESGLRAEGSSVEVLHLTEFLWRALEKAK